MAKPAITVTLIFLFIAISYARTTLDLPETDIKPSIYLPDEKPNLDPITAAKSKITNPEPESNSIESAEDMSSSETYIVDRVTLTRPATFVSFRPINRHFNVQQQFGLRLPLRRCRHHKKSIKVRYHGREVQYSNDMILAGDGSDSDRSVKGVVREIPARWVKFHHHEDDGLPEFPFEHHEFGKGKYKRHFKEGENGFLKKIRKFLKHF